MTLNRNLPRVDTTRFSMVPRSDVPRSTFRTQHTHKTTFDAGYLIPIYVDEVLPADVHKGNCTIFARLATPVFPIMDNITLETFFFFTPNRLLWDNWSKFMGERKNPSDSISYNIPQVIGTTGGYPVASLQDYLGLPVIGMINAGSNFTHNALPLRAYYKIWDDWFRDQNLQNALTASSAYTGDGPQSAGDFALARRNKKHDYFTSALPWPVKGGVEVTLPLSGSAYIKGLSIDDARTPTSGNPPTSNESGGSAPSGWSGYYSAATASTLYVRAVSPLAGADPLITADLSTALGQTINAIRLAFQTQKLLERDARGGTRYTEILRNHFGVDPEDSRMQRPEYIGGGRSNFQTQAIPQTSATGITGGTSSLGALGAAATVTDNHNFHFAAKEHGYILGLAHVTGETTYQQGLHRLWTRTTRYDFYWPAFAHLGEQAIRNDEIYVQGSTGGTADTTAFGYQERWAEYRHKPSRITGLFRSTSALTIDTWHLAQKFTALPTLSSSFIQDVPPFSRVLSAGSAANNMQILWDSVFNVEMTRALPMFSVPGDMDRF